jgi:hypothetical protein
MVMKEFEVLTSLHVQARARTGLPALLTAECENNNNKKPSTLCPSSSSSSLFKITPEMTVALSFATSSQRIVESARRVVTAMAARLFPFGRGLCHALWAPNAFPLYNVADRYLCKNVVRSRGTFPTLARSALSILRMSLGQGELQLIATKDFCDNVSVNTRGLVHLSAVTEESDASRESARLSVAPSHAVLPQITPTTCAHLVILGFIILSYSFFPPIVFILRMTPEQQQQYFDQRPRKIVRKFYAFAEHVAEDGAYGLLKLCIASSLSFFLFGWHVHEKAILNVLFPVVLYVALLMQPMNSRLAISKISFRHASKLDFLNLNLMAGLFVLPLLFTAKENVLKYLLLFSHQLCSKLLLDACWTSPSTEEDEAEKTVDLHCNDGSSTVTAKFTCFLLYLMVPISFWVDVKGHEAFLPMMMFSCVGSVALFGVIGSIRRILFQ